MGHAKQSEVLVKLAKEFEMKSETKNPAAVALGRLGGLKGGKARAAKLSASARKRIAANAAKARWSKKPQKNAGKT